MRSFGSLDLFRKARLDSAAILFGLGLGGVACGGADRVGFGAGSGQFTFIGPDGRVGFGLQAARFFQILGNARMTLIEDAPMRGAMTFCMSK
jgi:hypothetical protein